MKLPEPQTKTFSNLPGEIESRIIKQEIDREQQVELSDDYEEDASTYE